MTSNINDRVSVTKIEPVSGFATLDLKELWQYRDLIWFLTTRDIKARYRQMALGSFWILIGPIGFAIINTIIFGTLADLPSDGIPYPLFNYAALLPWTFFRSAMRSASNSLLQYMGMISKVYFPRLTVTIVGIISSMFDMLVSFSVLALLMAWYSYGITWKIIFLPFFILLAAFTSLAIGLWSAGLLVIYRDVIKFLDIVIAFWMYATPVVYAASVIPQEYLNLYKLNPMFWVIEGFRWSLLDSGTPPEPFMLIPIGFVFIMVLLGLYVFRRTELNIVDWL